MVLPSADTVLVPTDGVAWTFVHRTIHEYLAARMMVESGNFTPYEARRNWRRAQYAACFMPDASNFICQALDFNDELD